MIAMLWLFAAYGDAMTEATYGCEAGVGKPLQYINSPYLLMIAAYFVACLMSLAVSSATGLGGVLLMATSLPGDGQRRGLAAARVAAIAPLRRHHPLADVRRCVCRKSAEMPLTISCSKPRCHSIAAIIAGGDCALSGNAIR